MMLRDRACFPDGRRFAQVAFDAARRAYRPAPLKPMGVQVWKGATASKSSASPVRQPWGHHLVPILLTESPSSLGEQARASLEQYSQGTLFSTSLATRAPSPGRLPRTFGGAAGSSWVAAAARPLTAQGSNGSCEYGPMCFATASQESDGDLTKPTCRVS